ncbi:vitamin K epoxide reductase family protein [Saccharicrinis aurantiacus]|uniref:vitamin K epoxide reductase family protein n=1 Tax=Saccharicrinis aurantiacus TaxID=1849719 RepID=UPI00094F8E72|nr:vitamin K epoxide reductase family protein [Saccharicrinis aurantiacus]
MEIRKEHTNKLIFNICSKILNKHNVLFTKTKLRESIDLNSSIGTINAFSKVFDIYFLENITVQIPLKELNEIPQTSIAFLKDGEPIILQKTSGNIRYEDSEGNIHQLSINDFELAWSGYLIILGNGDTAFEPDYLNNLKDEKQTFLFNTIYRILLAFIPLLLFVITLTYKTYWIYPILIVIKLIGLGIGISLFFESHGESSFIGKQLCNLHKDFHCNKLLRSKTSNFLGIRLSDLVILYFSTSLLFLIIGIGSTNNMYLILVKTINLGTIPFIVFSISYQLYSKQWCLLCISTVFILTIEFTLFISTSFINNSINLTEVLIILLIITMIIFILFNFKNLIIKRYQLKQKDLRLNQLFNDKHILKSIIENGPELTDCPKQNMELLCSDAKNSIIMVFNPECMPCANSYKELTDLIKYMGQYISLNLIPVPNQNDQFSVKVSDFLLASLTKTEDIPIRLSLINSFFKAEKEGKTAILDWMENNPVDLDSIDKLSNQINNWCMKNNIYYTPCFIVNNKIVNNLLKVSEIMEYLKNNILETED